MELPHKSNKHIIRGSCYISSGRLYSIKLNNTIRGVDLSFRIIKY